MARAEFGVINLSGFILIALICLTIPAFVIVTLKKSKFSALRITYIFWAIFSLYNFSFLSPLAFPPLLYFYNKFLPFLIPVFTFSIVVSAFLFATVLMVCNKIYNKRFKREWLIYIFNILFLLIFLWSAESYKNRLINEELKKYKPDCVQINSFLASLGNAGEDFNFRAHALFKESGKTYYWSYSLLKFFEGNEQLDRNFPCIIKETK